MLQEDLPNILCKFFKSIIHEIRSVLFSTVFIPIPKKGNDKECSSNSTTALISQASEVMLKILQARPQQYVNVELPDAQACFRKGRGSDQMRSD